VAYVGKKCVLKVKLLSVPKKDQCKILAISAKFPPHVDIIPECFGTVTISNHGISVEERKIHAIKSWERPQNVVSVQAFLACVTTSDGLFLSLLASRHLSPIFPRKQIRFHGDGHRKCLSAALLNAPVLQFANYSLPFEVQSDASGVCLGAVLQQTEYHGTRPVANYSRKLNSAEQTMRFTSKNFWQ
jgi:hypothetical protein